MKKKGEKKERSAIAKKEEKPEKSRSAREIWTQARVGRGKEESAKKVTRRQRAAV